MVRIFNGVNEVARRVTAEYQQSDLESFEVCVEQSSCPGEVVQSGLQERVYDASAHAVSRHRDD